MNIVILEAREVIDNRFSLTTKEERGEHVLNILHKNVGDKFKAGVLNSSMGEATIISIDGGVVVCDYVPITVFDDGGKGTLLPISLILGIPRAVQLRRLVRDVVALRVQKFILTQTALGEPSYAHATILKEDNMRRLLVGAAAQTGTPVIPEYLMCTSLADAIVQSDISSKDTPFLKILMDTVGTVHLSRFVQNASHDTKIALAIGSERGWVSNERLLFSHCGYTFCTVGNRIMRSETATTVGLAIIESAMGWL